MQNTLRTVRNLIIFMPFWTMAFVTFLMRLFVAQPIGALLALTVGTVWCFGNAGRIREFAQSVHRRLFV